MDYSFGREPSRRFPAEGEFPEVTTEVTVQKNQGKNHDKGNTDPGTWL